MKGLQKAVEKIKKHLVFVDRYSKLKLDTKNKQMSKIKKHSLKKVLFVKPKKVSYIAVALMMVAFVLTPAFLPRHGSAALLTARSLSLSSSANGNIEQDATGTAAAPGSGGNGGKARHTVTFTMTTNNATVGSMIIMYCTSPIFTNTCTTPTGMSVEQLDAVTVEISAVGQGYTLDTSTGNATLTSAANSEGVCNAAGGAQPGDRANCVAFARGSTQTLTGTPTFVVRYGGTATDYVKNPTTDNYSFFARIFIFADTTYGGSLVDYGGVAASTAQQIDITARVQEILRFSVGRTSTPKISDGACTAYSDDGAIQIGDGNGVLDPALAYDNHTFFRINTNTVLGTNIYYSGGTLRSGSNDIDAIGAGGAVSQPGTEQFGLGINNAHTDSELDEVTPQAPYDSANGTLSPATASFAFVTGSVTTPALLALSTGPIVCATAAVRYLANISYSTPAGIYRTTITYIATGTY